MSLSMFRPVTLGVLLVNAAAAAGQETGPATERLDPFFSSVFEAAPVPGLAIAVVQGTEVVYLKGFGYADMEAARPFTPQTVAYIASSTKSFTGLAAALLDRQGVFELDAPLSRYLPHVELAEGLDASRITIRDLLTHTHGIANGGPVITRTAYTGEHTPEVLLELLKAHGPADNGRAFRYGNIGYNVASFAMDAVTGESWKDVERRLIFEPLGMSSTTGYRTQADPNRLAMPYRLRPDRGFDRLPFAKTDENMHAAGGLMTSAEDLAKWLEVNINLGVLDGRRVFPEEVMREAHSMLAQQSGRAGPFERVGYGLGWVVGLFKGDTVIHHNGGFPGHRTNISFMPAHGIGVAIVVNEGRAAGDVADLFTAYAYDRLLDRPGHEEEYAEWLGRVPGLLAQLHDRVRADRERRAARPQELPHPQSAYTGTFSHSLMGTMEFELVNGRLVARAGVLESDAIEVYNGENNQLRIELAGRGAVVTFEIENGRAVRITMGRATFERVDR